MTSDLIGRGTRGSGRSRSAACDPYGAQRSVRLWRPIGWLFLLLLWGACVIWFGYRPWALHWGATHDEIHGPMPGDDIAADATFIATRGVTINARPEQIWPWLIQMGYRRAGFYSYDRLDNDGIPSADRIIPAFQQLAVGDSIPLDNDDHAYVATMIPNRTLVWVIPSQEPWTWVWTLRPLNPQQTRLVTRLRVRPSNTMTRIMLDLGEIVMMRKCMLGIKRRAQAHSRN